MRRQFATILRAAADAVRSKGMNKISPSLDMTFDMILTKDEMASSGISINVPSGSG